MSVLTVHILSRDGTIALNLFSIHHPYCLQKGENVKRLRRESSAEIVVEDFVPGSEDRVISISLHRDSPNYTNTSGGDAIVAVFDNLCELARDSFTATTSSEEHDHTAEPDEDHSMNGNGIMHDTGECEARILVDTSRTFFTVAFK